MPQRPAFPASGTNDKKLFQRRISSAAHGARSRVLLNHGAVEPVRLASAAPERELLAAVRAELEAAVRHLRDDELSRADAVHEARRSLKRARAALSLLWLAEPHPAKAIDKGLRRLGRILSPFRDQDVIVALLRHMLEREDVVMKSRARAYLWHALAVEERNRHVLASDFPDASDAFAQAAEDLDKELECVETGRVCEQQVFEEIERSLAGVKQQFRAATASGLAEDFHRTRKITQRALNQLRLVVDVDSMKFAECLETLSALAKALGHLNDLDVLEQRIAEPVRDKMLRRGARDLLKQLEKDKTHHVGQASRLKAVLNLVR